MNFSWNEEKNQFRDTNGTFKSPYEANILIRIDECAYASLNS